MFVFEKINLDIGHLVFLTVTNVTSKSFLFFMSLTLIVGSANAGVTFKSGSAIKTGEDGKAYSEPYEEGFEKALKKPSTNWQVSNGSFATREGGYFGEQFMHPGTPLLRWTGLVIGDEYVEKLAQQNGFASTKSMAKFLVANGNSTFIRNIGVTEDEINIFLHSGLTDEDFDGKIIFEGVSEKIESEIETTIREKLEKEISEAIEDELVDSITQTIEDEINAMLENFENYSVGEWYQLSDGSFVCFYYEEGEC